MDEKEGRRSRTSRALSLAVAAVAAAGLSLMGLAAASAKAQPALPFNPSLNVVADDYDAGAHPNLTIRLAQTPNHCVEALYDPYNNPYCDGWYGGKYYPAYIEQDFKRLVLDLPAGLVSDPNAAPPCIPRYRSDGEPEDALFVCDPPVPPIGAITGTVDNCVRDLRAPDDIHPCGFAPGVDPWSAPILGDVYMGRREPGEQARLVLLVGAYLGRVMRHDALTYASVTVDPQGRITATTDGIPDTITEPASNAKVAIQSDQLWITLRGGSGAASGHPLLMNPTSCRSKALAGEAQGYANNVAFDGLGYKPGYGDGTTAPVSADYHAIGCNDVPYSPELNLELDTLTPGAVPAIKTELSQEVGEATTGSVKVVFPKGFRINFDNKAAQCPRDQFESGNCPESSKIGSASAFSELLPLDLEPRRLEGDVFLGETDFAAGTVRLYVRVAHPEWLPEGIWLTGNASIEADGSIITVFDDIPELPIQHFELSLDGGTEKGLLRNPSTCGTKQVESTLVTHQGRQLNVSNPVDISCTEPTFDVDLDSSRVGAHPTVVLTAASAGIRSLSFDLSRYLRIAKNAGALKTLDRYGTLSVSTEDGPREFKLKLLKRGGLGSLAFSATEAGTQFTSAGSFDVRLLGKSKKRALARSPRFRQGPKRLWLDRLPEGTTKVTVELLGSKDNFVQNPRRCRVKGKRLSLGFAAHIEGTDGSRQTLQRNQRMKCGKNQRSRRR